MMRTILVPFAPGLASESALDAALSFAKSMNSHIRTIFVRPDPTAALANIPNRLATTITREAIEREGRRIADEEKVRFESWRTRHAIPAVMTHHRIDSCFASWFETVGEIEQVVTRYGRLSDLIVMQRFAGDNVAGQRCFDAALFGTGRPTLLVPERLPWAKFDHILVAWNGSLEASHAVFGTLPLLHEASRVSIFSMPAAKNDQATAAELAEALSWQGILAYEAGFSEPTSSVGAALLGTAAQCNATLIVMGAYTHSRLRQSFLGGVTMHVLSEAKIPVLMSH
jgi:nucleotide-binding universal stress UspA family protein